MKTETDLARPIVAWLREQRWDVYQEVAVTSGGAVADIVVSQGNMLGVVECKTTLGLSVLGQCHRWRLMTNFVWAAAPWNRGGGGFGHVVAREYGIGILTVRELRGQHGPESFVTETVPPLLRRKTDPRLRNALRPEHASGAYAEAGAAGGGGRYTPFAATCNELRRVVLGNPGLTLREAIESIKHHYGSTATARSALTKWIRDGVVRGVDLRRDSRHLRLYPATEATK